MVDNGLRCFRTRLALLLLAGILMTVGASCGGSSGGSDSGSSGGGDSGSGSGGGGSSSDGFNITGTVVGPTSVNLAKGTSTSGTPTHVIAISPETANASCKIAEVGSANTFTLGITGKKPWFFFFLDKGKTGSKMFLGRVRSSGLDTLVPTATSGTLDLGTVTIDGATGIASSSTAHADVISSLGLSSDEADTIGDLDDVATRYENPDIDGDGSIDCNDSKQYFLDFHVRYNMVVAGQNAPVTDIIDSYLSDSATATYTGTGIFVVYPTSYSSTTSGSVTFTDSSITTSEGGAIPAGTSTSAVATNAFSGYNSFGPNTTSASELPSGEIIFAFGGHTLSFSGVQTPSLSALTAPTGRIFPFIKFNKNDASCTSSCTLASVGYKWMKKTASGWTAATQTELTLLVASASLGFRVGTDSNSSQIVSFTIPKTSTSGTIEWSSASLSGVSSSTLTSLVTTQLCHIGLSYDDQLGMRYFEGIQNADGTCS